MGTDIHVSAEKVILNDHGVEIGWEFVPGPIIDCWACKGTGIKHQWMGGTPTPLDPEEICYWCARVPDPDGDPDDYAYEMRSYIGPGKKRDTWFSGRNYVIFAVLADVRNGSGFAGVYTHDKITYISDPRGLPEDITQETEALLSYEHSASWLTLDEVMMYDWSQPLVQGGVVNLDEYREFLEKGKPTSWCGSIMGTDIENVTVEQADLLIAEGATKVTHPNTVVNIKWTDSVSDYAEEFIKRMKMLINEVGPTKCRLVFDFDS